MSALILLVAWCTTGGAIGWLIGAPIGRSRVGLVLGSLMGVFGWVLMLGAEPLQGSPPVAPSLPMARWKNIFRLPSSGTASTEAVEPA
jgi:hypothetical protein